MHQASIVLACAGIDVLQMADAVAEVRTEFETSSAEFPYVSPVGPDDVPQLPSHLR